METLLVQPKEQMIFPDQLDQFRFERLRAESEALDAIEIHKHLVLVNQPKFSKCRELDRTMQEAILGEVVRRTVKRVRQLLS